MSSANTPPYIHAEGHVLAAVDESAYTESVCRHAAWAALRLGAPLAFVHALDRSREAAPVNLSGSLALGEQEDLLLDLSAIDERRSARAQQRGRLLLQQARAFAASAGMAETGGRLRHGGLVGTLTDLEADVRLFVLGKRGDQTGGRDRADLASAELGGQLERVVRTVHRPLLVAAREFLPIRSALIAFDGSASTCKGVQMIAASPLLRGLDLHVVTAGAASETATRDLQWAEAVLAEAGFQPRTALIGGGAEDVIGAYVREHRIDLLVMGAYGHSRIRDLIVGSTTTAMLRSCRIPVLLLR